MGGYKLLMVVKDIETSLCVMVTFVVVCGDFVVVCGERRGASGFG